MVFFRNSLPSFLSHFTIAAHNEYNSNYSNKYDNDNNRTIYGVRGSILVVRQSFLLHGHTLFAISSLLSYLINVSEILLLLSGIVRSLLRDKLTEFIIVTHKS